MIYKLNQFLNKNVIMQQVLNKKTGSLQEVIQEKMMKMKKQVVNEK